GGAVPLTVGGNRGGVRGELVVAEDVSPVPWAALALVAGGLVAVAGTRRRPLATRVAAGATLVVALGAVLAAWSTYRLAPPGSGASPVPVAVAAVGAVAAAAGLGLWACTARGVVSLAEAD